MKHKKGKNSPHQNPGKKQGPVFNRRGFLAGLAGVAGIGGLGLAGKKLWKLPRAGAMEFPASHERTLMNILLAGGPDFRHLIVPPPSTTYGQAYWQFRSSVQGTNPSDSATWGERYADAYTQINFDGHTFGVLSEADWLISQIQAGNVAIVCNVLHAENRNHSFAQLILETGNYDSGAHDFDASGWGGRLVEAIDSKVLSVTNQRLVFCNGSNQDNSRVISMQDSRNFGLYRDSRLDPTSDNYSPGSTSSGAIMTRALESYYNALQASGDITEDSPYYKILRHEAALRDITNQVNNRLAGHEIPADIEGLTSGDNRLYDRGFGGQIANAYDGFLCADILGFRTVSMSYGGWDTHKRQQRNIERYFHDLFHTTGGLSVLTNRLATDMPTTNNNYVISIAGEFGRQLRSNGDEGTDHGRGNMMLLIGPSVQGGVYGELFPQKELDESLYASYNKDIEGRTSFERVLGSACDWVAGNSSAGDSVFPGRASSIQESGFTIDAANLFA